ncbi:MAG TPA: phosphate/phosphite/phosphonate ABC transporter substrate-binding protein [Anaeromyxobacteraceae bacterium]|nr:phosphate/phosphite/phosphonate ABC transporter substrate-binding protein [Anaeromyxobacteraceae bacterium]
MKHPTLAALPLIAFLGALAAPLDAASAEPLLVGIAARISPRESYAYYDRLLAYVGKKLGRHVEMVQFSTYDEMDTALERRDLDYAFICSGPYVRDHAKFGVELLAAPQSHGQPFYYAYVIVPAASPARTLADLRGKRFAFTDRKSNTGRLVPTYLVQREFGVSPESWFSSIGYLGSHDAAIDAVDAGTVDGASVDSLIFDYVAARNPGRVKNVRILMKSPPFGIPPVVVNRRADPAVRKHVRDVLLSMHSDPEGQRILDGIMVDRFIVPIDANYDAVREMESWLAGQARAR